MRRFARMFILVFFLMLAPSVSVAQTRALLVACSEFVTQHDLGNAISGNLHMIGSALLNANIGASDLSIEDGTIATREHLADAIDEAFTGSDEDDLSILYLCTHGILSSSDDGQVYLLLGDGQTETPLMGSELCEMVSAIQGEKLLILDACFSGALIGRGMPSQTALPGERRSIDHAYSEQYAAPFLADPSIHVLTSADGYESSWYFDSEQLTSGAVSYFASAISSGLGLYGAIEADLNGDGAVTLDELHRYLGVALPSSASQLLSSSAQSVVLPAANGSVLSRPLSGFTYGSSLLSADDPTLEFSFTVSREDTNVQYRLIDFADGRWNWEGASTFLDSDATLGVGRKTRTLSLAGDVPENGGYMMLQIFSVTGSEVILCSERLIAVQPSGSEAGISVKAGRNMGQGTLTEVPIAVRMTVPAEVTVSVYSQSGELIRRVAHSQLTRPAPDYMTMFYWDGRDMQGNPVDPGSYVITAETRVDGKRRTAECELTV